MKGIRRRLGVRWAYHLRETITLGNEEDWSLLLSMLQTQTAPLPRDRRWNACLPAPMPLSSIATFCAMKNGRCA